MCGLAGVMSRNLDMTQINKFRDIYTIAQLRGDTGAGIMAVPTVTKPSGVQHVAIRRTAWSSGHLVTTQDFFDAVKKSVSIIAGHARAPTRGGTELRNVHPHRAGDIILMHNGTMTSVDKTVVSSTQKHTDSSMIAECIAKHGPQHFVDNSYGAYALVWIDLKKQTLNFLRNNERSLMLGFEKDTLIGGKLDALWWASESPMMQYPLARYTNFNSGRFEFKPLPANEWWSWPLDVGLTICDPEVIRCEKKSYAGSFGSGYGSYGSWDGDDYGDYHYRSPSASDNLPKSNDTNAQGTQRTSVPSVVTSGGFKYTPPEYRGEDKGSEDTSTKMSFMSVPEVLRKRRAEAARAAGMAMAQEIGGSPSMEENQKQTKYLLSYALKDDDEVKLRLANGACVWCNETPTEVIEGIPPTIFPIHHTENRHEYVCSECITDDNVQSFVGIKKVM